jgi:hypothetical protein
VGGESSFQFTHELIWQPIFGFWHDCVCISSLPTLGSLPSSSPKHSEEGKQPSLKLPNMKGLVGIHSPLLIFIYVLSAITKFLPMYLKHPPITKSNLKFNIILRLILSQTLLDWCIYFSIISRASSVWWSCMKYNVSENEEDQSRNVSSLLKESLGTEASVRTYLYFRACPVFGV